ncbi:MAG: hypothetical protein JNK04_05345 [Myxococcales bacterium]|nr:hypothetical protein [Myxococcales bacterium]
MGESGTNPAMVVSSARAPLLAGLREKTDPGVGAPPPAEEKQQASKRSPASMRPFGALVPGAKSAPPPSPADDPPLFGAPAPSPPAAPPPAPTSPSAVSPPANADVALSKTMPSQTRELQARVRAALAAGRAAEDGESGEPAPSKDREGT